MQQDEVKVLLDGLEREIKRLRMEYNRYLAQAPDVNIEFCEKRVTDIIHLLQKTAFKKYIQKFRFDNLLARYNVMRINFNRMAGVRDKKLADIKERLGMPTVPEPADISEKRKAAAGDRSTLNLRNAGEQTGDLENFYARYVEMKTMREGLVTMSYEDFTTKVVGRVERIQMEGRGKTVQLRLVDEDGKIKIKTKVVK